MNEAYQQFRSTARPCRPTRREFLQCSLVGGLGLAGRCVVPFEAPESARDDRAVVLIVNVGGPSHVDTWDPKPDAPAETRGPFRAIRTSVPGIFLSELFPRQARIAHLQAFVRACCHPAPAVHQVGWQMAQTGREYPAANHAPHAADVVARMCAQRSGWPTHVTLPCDTEPVAVAHERLAPHCSRLLAREPVHIQERYGASRFGQQCLLARCLIEAGTRFVTIRTCNDYRDPDSWDVHGGPEFGTVESMSRGFAPVFDQAYSALVEDLAQRGMLDTTLVCCVAEFGRTPRMNPAGGRDHWPQCWTTVLAGGGVRGGQVVGASDASGGQPADRPVSPAEIVGTIYRSLHLLADPTRRQTSVADLALIPSSMRPIEELF